ncbi:MAG TPA: hypothetical protein VM537_09380, partial [Anaerolineae bacterium]|nr:hypothetical protein [Anaerolineae bacterium]
MTQVKRATGQHGMAWWERLVFERPREEFTACPTCSTVYDSVDVVCTADNAALVGTQMADSRKTAIVNAVRIVAVAVALAVGYLNWTWPTYVFGAFIVISFFGLFLRN